MDNEEKNEQAQNVPDREREPDGPQEPRGNPEQDPGAAEKGEEQLGKISGN